MTSRLKALPSTFQTFPMLPFAPTLGGDRDHEWNTPGEIVSTPSGLSIVAVDNAGVETVTLNYVGCTRADARALEDFVNARGGRKSGFWCPTFQDDYHVVSANPVSDGILHVRDTGYAPVVLANAWARHIAAVRGGAWYFVTMNAASTAEGLDASGFPTRAYAISPDGEGTGSALATKTFADGLLVMRLLWVRFADDAITTEWAHPNLAAITLRVQTIPGESS